MDLGHFSISLAVKDLAASRRFYETFGLQVIDGDGERWLMMASGKARVGLFQQMFEQNLITFNPADARSIEKAFNNAGYAIDKPTEGSEGPTHFALRDPDGNSILVDQYEVKAEAPPIGKAGWIDLTVPDADALKAFYCDVLGVKASAVDMGGYSDYCLLDASGAPGAGVCHARGPNTGLPPIWMVYFVVDDIEASMDRVIANGGQVLRPPKSVAGSSRYCVIQDPQGTTCALFQHASEADAGS